MDPGISFTVSTRRPYSLVVVELLSKTRNTISSNVPYSLIKETLFFINLHRLQINDADVVVPTAGSHNYNENINRSIIQFALKFIKDSQRCE